MPLSFIKDHRCGKWATLFLILCIGAIILAGLTRYDYQWTLYFSTHKLKYFAEFMNRSVFNGDPLPGAGDLIYPLLLITLLLYIPSWLWRHDRPLSERGLGSFFASCRPLCGFILFSAFSCSLLFTHTVKQIMGRARPDSVFSGKSPFSEWYHSGPLFFTHGSYTGSFPSGHTATAAITIIFAYVVLACLTEKKSRIGLTFFVFSILFTVLMGISRMMSASHWLTDVIFTLFSQWALIHIIFHFVLKIPERQAYFRQNRIPYPQKRFFELRLCLIMIPICVGIWAFFTGLRSYHFEGLSWLLALVPAGLVMTLIFLRRAWILVSGTPRP
jgi:membrane-associated phospholipid phosphatase